MDINDLTKVAGELLKEIDSYNTKPNKAKSKRIRLLLGQIKNATPGLRATLVEADKSGY